MPIRISSVILLVESQLVIRYPSYLRTCSYCFRLLCILPGMQDRAETSLSPSCYCYLFIVCWNIYFNKLKDVMFVFYFNYIVNRDLEIITENFVLYCCVDCFLKFCVTYIFCYSYLRSLQICIHLYCRIMYLLVFFLYSKLILIYLHSYQAILKFKIFSKYLFFSA